MKLNILLAYVLFVVAVLGFLMENVFWEDEWFIHVLGGLQKRAQLQAILVDYRYYPWYFNGIILLCMFSLWLFRGKYDRIKGD